MDIDEFIEHTKEKAREHRYHADFFESDNPMNTACIKSAEDCEQLAGWLKKAEEYQQLEERLNKVYGDCDGLLLRVVEMLEKHPCIDMANNTLKSRLLTDEDVDKWEEYKQLDDQGRLVKLPVKNDMAEYRECVHTKSQCHHENCKCSECPLTELLCDEFYKAIDRCYEEAYASGCLAGIELGKFEAEAKLEELRGGENGSME